MPNSIVDAEVVGNVCQSSPTIGEGNHHIEGTLKPYVKL